MRTAAPAILAALSAAAFVLGLWQAARVRVAPTGSLSRRITVHPRLGPVLAAMSRAGVPGDPAAVLPVAAMAAVTVAVLIWALTGSVIGAVAVIGGAVLGARRLLAGADRRYARRVARQLPGVAGDLAVGVGAGLSLRQAVVRVGRDAPEPVGAELRRVADEMDLGTPVDEALDAMASRLPEPDMVLMVTAIVVQRRTGGNLARALGELASRLDERSALERELRGATAQARATAWLVAALPVVGGLALELAAPGVLQRTLGHGIGLALLAAALLLDAVGVMLVRRLARIEP